MMTLHDAAREFLARKRIAVVGVSRHADEAANFVFRKLRDSGHEVIAVNAHARIVEGVRGYPDLRSIPGGVDAVAIFTPPSATAEVVRECADLGITHVWLHRALGAGSFSEEAVRVAHERGLTLIPGGCPAMFCEGADLPHRCMRWLLELTRKLPRKVETPVA